MAFETLQAPSARNNYTLQDGDALLAKLEAGGSHGVLFCNTVGGAGAQTGMIPEKAKQDNGTAPWVDAASNLEKMGVPRDLPIYLQIWVEKKQNYYIAAGVAKSLAHGLTVEQALS